MDMAEPPPIDGGTQLGCAGDAKGCYTVYAHSDYELYRVDLVTKQLVRVGNFQAPMVLDNNGNSVTDVITDLAVAPDNTIYVVSRTHLYRADPNDGHVTSVGAITNCGSFGVALTFTPDGKLYTADFMGAFCRIDLSTTPPTVTPVGQVGGGLALSGDLVAVGDGTVYGTAYRLSDSSNQGTQINNILVKLDPTTGRATQMLGQTGFPKLFGAAYALGQVFAFTHDNSGDVITVNPMTGVGTLFNTFTDPMSGKPISFAGAGVNALVAPSIQ
jgi:hypothetical protein